MTRRLRAIALPAGLIGAIVIAIAGATLVLTSRESAADLDNQVFSSPADRLQMVVPRGWRATDQPSYPGLLLWMMRSKPQGLLVLTAEPFTRKLYCSWPIACRTSNDTLPAQYACALRDKLEKQRMHVGPIQAGPRDTDPSGLPSVWLEYDDGRTFLRQAVALSADRAVSLVLSAPTLDARAIHVRPFDQSLRTLRTWTAIEATADGGVPPPDAAPAAAPATTDGGAATTAAAPASTPTPKINPVGPCPQ